MAVRKVSLFSWWATRQMHFIASCDILIKNTPASDSTLDKNMQALPATLSSWPKVLPASAGSSGREGSRPEPLSPRGLSCSSCHSFSQAPRRRHTTNGFKHTETRLILRRSSPRCAGSALLHENGLIGFQPRDEGVNSGWKQVSTARQGHRWWESYSSLGAGHMMPSEM